MKINILVYIFLLLGLTTSGFGQILESSLNYNPVKFQSEIPKIDLRSNQPLTLPFADDFSGQVGYPDPQYWEDSQAFVNRSLGLNPPSIGVLTLDGLDAEGLPYGGGYGGSDTLTSRPIDMSTE